MQVSQDGELPVSQQPLSLSPNNGSLLTTAESSTGRDYDSQFIPSSEELYGSDESDSSDRDSIPCSPHKEKAGRLRLIDKQPSSEIEEYFKKIQSSFDKLLLEEVRSHQPPDMEYEPMSTRLTMRGTSNDNCGPCIVVSCQPKYKNVLEASIGKDPIIDVICLPKYVAAQAFQVIVLGSLPQPFPASNTQVIAETESGPQKNVTGMLRGTPICLETPDGRRRNATFVGMIEVETASGRSDLLGLTCGHEIHRWDEDIGKEDGESDSDSEYESTFPIHINDDEVSPWDFKEPTVIGRIIDIPEDVMFRGGKLFDWALFQPNSYKTNQLPVKPSAKLRVCTQRPRDVRSRSLRVLSKQPWDSKACYTCQMLLGEQYTDVYKVCTKGPVMRRGDEGAWIINLETSEVLGQFMAGSNFRHVGYFVPMADILNDIKWKLGARSVQLASPDDISNFEAGVYQAPSPINSGERVNSAVEIQPSNYKNESGGRKRRFSEVNHLTVPSDITRDENMMPPRKIRR